jgi:pimeloyl-ACP methyl ester carboxylesterase
MPTLIIWGDHDHIIPVEQGHATHAAIPGSRLEIFARKGHVPHCEDPERFAGVVADFIGTTAPASISAAAWRDRITAATAI